MGSPSDNGAAARKKIIQTALVLSALTALEFIIAFTMAKGATRVWIFIILTIVKAFYIVAEFMHLKHEVKRLVWGILIPFIAFILWLLIALFIEGESWGEVF